MNKTALLDLYNPHDLEAFLDDFNEIVIKAPKNFYTHNDSFSLENINTNEKLNNLQIAYIDDKNTFSYLHLFIKSNFIDFKNYYKIIGKYNYEIALKFGQIIKKEIFDEIFFYSGNDLGPTYSKQSTTFKVWSPTSYKLRLKIKKSFNDIAEYFDMERQEKGIWQITISRDLESYLYQYEVENNFITSETIDPYAKASTANGKYSYVINLDLLEKYNFVYKSKLANKTDRIIYEISIRDFTDSNEFKYPGKYLGLTEEGIKNKDGFSIGIDHIKNLGINTVQIMPFYDFATVDEERDVENQYNWGYDPLQWMVPEGSYSTNSYDPYLRLIETKKMINNFHKNDIDVVMDVVFNHVYDAFSFSWHILAPHYFYRYNTDLSLSNMSGTGNDVASEKKMVRKYIVDVVKHWQETFKIDGLRFDLMGLLDIETILEVDENTKNNNSNFIIYGEGWVMNSESTKKILANMENSRFLANIGFFNDYFRDVFKGNQWNVYSKSFSAGDWQQGHKALNSITGSLGLYEYAKKFNFLSQSVNYVECHDNYTLFDFFKIKLSSFSDFTIKKIHALTTAITLISQGIPFIHAGQEIFRTKYNVENSYNFPIEINRFEWNKLKENYWNVELIKKIIEIRKKYNLFRLETIQLVKEHVKIFVGNNSLIYYLLEDSDYSIQVNININQNDIEIDLDSNFWTCILNSQNLENNEIKNNKILIEAHGFYIFIKNKKKVK
ncbi:type I pullulanase [[Mycoplasma] mobile]|uniref:Pullulanase n=1 Tax=Mycoplasma mobile (strain ATCC 43663 / 163K / NCTC 11711) TaxID=267748 RepID=Q6KHP4_MYCM1|nr:type I pullulanase [[Mycoplasma] mobile]AAT27886.1 pullulanase [Mycoplasma mobile 163K]